MLWESYVWTIMLILLQLTGRVEPKRRWSDGIHQAVEAKEGLKIQVIIDLNKTIYDIIFNRSLSFSESLR